MALTWAAGLLAGFVALLGATAKYGCEAGNGGLGCRTSGSLLGVLLVLVVIAVVSAVTLVTAGRSARVVLLVGGTGLVALVLCLVAARMLLDTT